MSAFKDILDVALLPEHELGHIEFVLASPAYGDHFEPYLRRMRDTLNRQLLDPSRDRQDRYNDDFLRGGINMIDGLLELFAKLVEETQIERIQRAQAERTGEETYESMRQDGQARPAGQTKQPADYNPNEDF